VQPDGCSPSTSLARNSTLYVDAARGSDANDGSEGAPLAHLATAVLRARALPPPATILLRDSAPHRLASPLQLAAADSGLTVANFPGETPVLTSGLLLNTVWKAAPAPRGGGGACSLLPPKTPCTTTGRLPAS